MNLASTTIFPATSLGVDMEMSLTLTMRRSLPSESKKVAISWKLPVTVMGMGMRA